jgi:predicted metal-binding membrane protein
MTVLVVVGLMNLVWMALLALVFLAEKNWRYGIGLNWIVGTAVAVLGLAVFLFPDVLGVVTGAGAPVMTSGI